MKVIAIVNQKGGVGKTTSSIEISVRLAAEGKKVGLIDLDAQGNSTRGMGIDKTELEYTIYDLMKKKARIGDLRKIELSDVVINKYGVDIYPNNIRMAKADKDLAHAINKENVLRNTIDSYFPKDYDYLILDCPPHLGLIVDNALIASDLVYIPVCADVYSIEGIGDLLDSIDLVKEEANSKLDIGGVFLTMVQQRQKIFQEAYAALKEFFPDRMLNTCIRMAVKVDDCIREGVPVTIKAPDCNPAIDYIELTKEILARG